MLELGSLIAEALPPFRLVTVQTGLITAFDAVIGLLLFVRDSIQFCGVGPR
jgi:hypothetical protein